MILLVYGHPHIHVGSYCLLLPSMEVFHEKSDFYKIDLYFDIFQTKTGGEQFCNSFLMNPANMYCLADGTIHWLVSFFGGIMSFNFIFTIVFFLFNHFVW